MRSLFIDTYSIPWVSFYLSICVSGVPCATRYEGGAQADEADFHRGVKSSFMPQ